MKIFPLLVIAGGVLIASPTAMATPAILTVDLAAPAKPISPELFGIFFEDLNYAADGGLYAELLQNRSFEYSATEQAAWGPFSFWDPVKLGTGEGHLGLGDSRPVHPNNPHYLVLNVTQAGNGVGIANRGFDQLPLVGGQAYEASFWAYQAFMGPKWGGPGPRVDQKTPMPVTVRLEGKDGSILAEAKFEITGRTWSQHKATLTPSRSDPEARFVLLAHEAGGIALDMISLFPKDTFKGRANGLRRDLAETIADLKPRFVRFPGGCLVHGTGTHAYYDWKHSVGPVEQRVAARNSWGYHQTMGLGYFEYFQFCEDLGATPVPVVTAGVCCQHAGDSPGRGQEGLPLGEMPAYIQDILDLVEWANGPATSKWGSVRAAAGHPEPFGLKYLGVGNEDAITPEFKERFAMIHSALRQKHPEITIIGTSGPFHSGEDFDHGWNFARKLNLPLVDEHYYVPPQWMWENLARYDGYDRAGPKVYLGEYAAHEKDRRNTLRTALAEAAHLTSLERNGDIVRLASYAPLLARRQHTQWQPDMIYFTGTEVFPSLNYTVQKLFGHNLGDAAPPITLHRGSTGARLAASAVKDSQTGNLIIKIVNGDDTPQALSINLTGGVKLPAVAERTVFGHASADVVNSDGAPPAVVPQTDSIPLAPNFNYEAPPCSLTILRLRLAAPPQPTGTVIVPALEKPAGAGPRSEKDFGGYLMVYFKDETHSAYFAISRDGYTFTDVNGGAPVFDGTRLAEQKGVRDPHIARGPDGAFYLAMTDLHIYGKQAGHRTTDWQRPQEPFGWGNNRALILMKSWDLIHWTHSDFRVDLAFPELGEIDCSWAPQTTWDAVAGKMVVYFTIRYGNKNANIYWAYADEDFTKLVTTPTRIPGIGGIDADLTFVNGKWHMFYVSAATIRYASSDRLADGYTTTPPRIDPETVPTEAPNVFKRTGTSTYVLMYDVYGAKPNNMGFSETEDFVTWHHLGRFNEGVMKGTNFERPKHGAVIPLTLDELRAVAAHWKIDIKLD